MGRDPRKDGHVSDRIVIRDERVPGEPMVEHGVEPAYFSPESADHIGRFTRRRMPLEMAQLPAHRTKYGHGDQVYVRLSLGCLGPGHEVMFRRVAGRKDYCGERNHWASLQELVHPDSFAIRLRRELTLTGGAAPSGRLFA